MCVIFCAQDPSASIPKGTLLSILITMTSYVAMIIVPGAVQLREASGDPNEYAFNNGSHLDCSFRNCTKGLYYDENVNTAYILLYLHKLRNSSVRVSFTRGIFSFSYS